MNNIRNNKSNHESRNKKLSYSFNIGLCKQPCYKPYESIDNNYINNINLDFNYWINNDYMIDQQVIELIMSLINNKQYKSSVINIKECYDAKHILVTTIQGIDPLELQTNLEHLPFLNKLSYMPIKHMIQTSDNIITCNHTSTTTNNTNKFHHNQYNDNYVWEHFSVAPMNSLLLWKEKTLSIVTNNNTIASSDLKNNVILTNTNNIKQLFKDNTLIFKVLDIIYTYR